MIYLVLAEHWLMEYFEEYEPPMSASSLCGEICVSFSKKLHTAKNIIGIFIYIPHLYTQILVCMGASMHTLRSNLIKNYNNNEDIEYSKDYGSCTKIGYRISGMGMSGKRRYKHCILPGVRSLLIDFQVHLMSFLLCIQHELFTSSNHGIWHGRCTAETGRTELKKCVAFTCTSGHQARSLGGRRSLFDPPRRCHDAQTWTFSLPQQGTEEQVLRDPGRQGMSVRDRKNLISKVQAHTYVFTF